MHARQPTPLQFSSSSSSVRSVKGSVPADSRSVPRRWGREKAIAIESTARLVINFVVAVTATTGLFRLIPYHLTLQNQLSQLEVEVQATQNRVNRLQAEFDRTFDPEQASVLMQEESHRVDGKRRPIVWLDPQP